MKNLSLFALALVGCVTINIYFPAEEVKNAADQIVQEVWSEGQEAGSNGAGPISFLLQLVSPTTAHAEQNINVSTPQIRAIKESMKQRVPKLRGYLDGGQIGIGNDGLLKLRGAGGGDLKSRAEMTRLIGEENRDRENLYTEIAKANGFPNKVQEVKGIFAQSWKGDASPGWYIEQGDGSWKKK